MTRTAEFVRGFFADLEARGVQAAVLHGGDDGFESDLSDVDFVVDHHAFSNLPAVIGEYCAQSGWRLCQTLRHETTAAYHVCSAADDPACAVALDACSDYQRNGTVFLTAECLLENLRSLAWGGRALSRANALRYRFAKAAAKNKDANAAAAEFADYHEELRHECAVWLTEQWDIALQTWDAASLAAALAKLREKSNHRPCLNQAGAPGRILSRILRPTGLIVLAGQDDFDATADRLEKVFGRLYFRRFLKADRWQVSMVKDLVASTLIVVPQLGMSWPKLLPAECIHRADTTHDPDILCRELALHLHQRCKHRESR